MDQDLASPERRIRFDPTINAGHVLTFIGMMAVGFGAWATMDTRVTLLEENRAHQSARDESQDKLITDKMADIKEALRDMRNSLDELRRDQKVSREPRQ